MHAFNRLINEGKEGPFVVFTDPETGKFVQFPYEVETKVLLIDVPLAELTKDEEDKIRSILGEEGAVDVGTSEKVSYQEISQVIEVERAIKLIEEIFVSVFNLPKSFAFDCDVVLN